MIRFIDRNGTVLFFVGVATILLVVLSGCTYALTRQYLLVDNEALPSVVGWDIRPKIYAYEEIIDADTLTHLYDFSIILERARPKEMETIGPVSFVEIDQVRVILDGYQDDLVLPLRRAIWVSNSSSPKITQVLLFGDGSVDIPLKAKEVTLECTVQIWPGQHFLTMRYESVPMDTVAVDKRGPAIDSMIVTIPMIRVDSKRKVPFFMRYN